MSDKLIKKLNDRISSNKTSIGFIEAEIPKYEETIGEFIEITIPIENKIISVASSINSLQQQIVSIATSAFNVGCGTTAGATIVYPDTVKTHNENVTSPSYDGFDPFGGQTSSVLSSSNVGIGTFLVFTQNDSSQTGLGTLYGVIQSCFRLPCTGSDCVDYNLQITSLQSQIVTLRGQLPPEITKVNSVRTEKKNAEIERYGQKRGVASLKQRNSEMESAINNINAINDISPTSNTVIQDQSLKLYYDADASNTLQPETPGTGNIWKDISVNGNHGIITDANYESTSPQFFRFNGTSAVVNTSSTITHGTGDITYECWVRTTNGYTPSDWASLMSTYGGSSSENGFWIMLKYSYTYITVGNDAILYTTTSTTVNDGDWHHIVATYTNRIIRIYFDGSHIGGMINAPDNDLPARTLHIGAMLVTGSLDRFFNGDIGEVRVYDKALSPTEIIQNYNVTKARYE
jgi:hypothetical protein